MTLPVAELIDADSSQLGEPSPVQPPRHNPFHDAAHRHPRYPQQAAHRRPVRHLRQIRRQFLEPRREHAAAARPRHLLHLHPAATPARHPPRRIPQPRRHPAPGQMPPLAHRLPVIPRRPLPARPAPGTPPRRLHRPVNGPSAAISTCLTYICVTPNSRRSNVVRRMGLSSSRVVVIHAHETRKPLAFATASAKRDDARGPDNTLGPAQRASAAGAGPRGGRWGNQPASIPKPPAVALFRVVVDGRDAPSRPGRKAHICCLSGGTDGVSPEGPQRSEGRA